MSEGAIWGLFGTILTVVFTFAGVVFSTRSKARADEPLELLKQYKTMVDTLRTDLRDARADLLGARQEIGMLREEVAGLRGELANAHQELELARSTRVHPGFGQ